MSFGGSYLEFLLNAKQNKIRKTTAKKQNKNKNKH
jgi:hypothetical protein